MSDLAPLLAEVRSLNASVEVEDGALRVRGLSRLPPRLLATLHNQKPGLLAYLPSSRRILDDAGVKAVYAAAEAGASALLEQVLLDAAGGPIGLDIETYVPPSMAPPPVLKLTRNGARVAAAKDDKTGLDPIALRYAYCKSMGAEIFAPCWICRRYRGRHSLPCGQVNSSSTTANLNWGFSGRKTSTPLPSNARCRQPG